MLVAVSGDPAGLLSTPQPTTDFLAADVLDEESTPREPYAVPLSHIRSLALWRI